MKIYVYRHKYGNYIIIANSKQEAEKKLENYNVYCTSDPIEVSSECLYAPLVGDLKVL